ncbi:hypothetical protein M514_01740 [Trichuris suis]|uniref:Leucine Rich repeat-containing domain protein n=1 Tax=Trichuris suis TaxID=68888 RepID=A0A085NT23_9BILA|nr:hypothetical protein M514_01740 [Trichuris suis]
MHQPWKNMSLRCYGVVMKIYWLLLLVELAKCQSIFPPRNVSCPFSSDCTCSSTQCSGPIDVWCTDQRQFPIFTANSNCEVASLLIEGQYDNVPSRGLAAFTDRVFNLKLISKTSTILQFDPQAFQGSIGLFLERFELEDERALTEFPSALKAFKKLHTLILNNTAIARIPHGILSEKILETLRISNSRINDIDRDALVNLPFLFSFELPGNNLTAFPRDALLPVMPSLRSLDLSNNQIILLETGSFHGFDRLKQLNLSGNPLALLENGSLNGLERSLMDLDLSKCMITDFPTASLNTLTSLKTLDLSENRITAIPRNAFSGMSNLVKVNLENNPIKVIEPGAFVHATFDTLTLRASKMQQLDLETFLGSTTLTKIVVADNPMLKTVFSSKNNLESEYALKEIHLYNNNITNLDYSLSDWLSREGSKVTIEQNEFFDCNETAVSWLAAVQKCFQSSQLDVGNVKCAPVTIEEELFGNFTTLESTLNRINVDCRQFLTSTTARTTLKPTSKRRNSATSLYINSGVVVLVVSRIVGSMTGILP